MWRLGIEFFREILWWWPFALCCLCAAQTEITSGEVSIERLEQVGKNAAADKVLRVGVTSPSAGSNRSEQGHYRSQPLEKPEPAPTSIRRRIACY